MSFLAGTRVPSQLSSSPQDLELYLSKVPFALQDSFLKNTVPTAHGNITPAAMANAAIVISLTIALKRHKKPNIKILAE